jgi:cysteine desulfuration protein SufE
MSLSYLMIGWTNTTTSLNWGSHCQAFDQEFKQDKYLIKGCQAQVWLYPNFKDGKVFFTADSDALITKGIVALLIRVLSGQPAAEIIK